MNHIDAAKKLGKELLTMGYTYRLDETHNHPRLYVISKDKEIFTTLSRSASYSTGDLLKVKMGDIKRDVLPNLPSPFRVPPTTPHKSPTIKPTKPTPPKTVSISKAAKPTPPNNNSKVWSIKVFIIGHKVLAIQISKEFLHHYTSNISRAIGANENRATPFLTVDKHQLGLLFGPDGKPPGKTASSSQLAYRFSKAEVPFKYADKMPKGMKAAELCARLHGNSLICDEPLPKEILTGKLTTPPKDRYSLDDGSELISMLNSWINWAEHEGHEPKLTVEGNQVHVKVVERIERQL